MRYVLLGLLVCEAISQAVCTPEEELGVLKLRFSSLRHRYKQLCNQYSELAGNCSAPGTAPSSSRLCGKLVYAAHVLLYSFMCWEAFGWSLLSLIPLHRAHLYRVSSRMVSGRGSVLPHENWQERLASKWKKLWSRGWTARHLNHQRRACKCYCVWGCMYVMYLNLFDNLKKGCKCCCNVFIGSCGERRQEDRGALHTLLDWTEWHQDRRRMEMGGQLKPYKPHVCMTEIQIIVPRLTNNMLMVICQVKAAAACTDRELYLGFIDL